MVVKVNGKDVTPDNTLSYIVSNLPIGSRVPIDLIRRGQHMTLTAVIAERPPEDQLAGTLGGDDGDDNGDDDNGTPSAQSKAATSALGIVLQPLSPRVAQQLGIPATRARGGDRLGRSVERRGLQRPQARRRDAVDQPAAGDDDRGGGAGSGRRP